MPDFAEFDEATCTFTFFPLKKAGEFDVVGYITDLGNKTDFSFKVTVYNRSPSLRVSPRPQKVELTVKH